MVIEIIPPFKQQKNLTKRNWTTSRFICWSVAIPIVAISKETEAYKFDDRTGNYKNRKSS